MRIACNLFPGGRPGTLTLSYDDGTVHDRRLVEILDRHGIRGAFHLNSGLLDTEGYLRSAEVADLFRNHEVSAHTVTHPHLPDLPRDRVASEILEDRRALEGLVGYPVRGLSYPFGGHDARVRAMLPSLGIEYARTVERRDGFETPSDFLAWGPTCHHGDGLLERAEAFLARERGWHRHVLYVWGHSYEFAQDGTWDLVEAFCRRVGGREDVWYATNIEIVDYTQAVASLRFTLSGEAVHNPSAPAVWISVDGKAVEIGAGQRVRL